MAQTAVTATIDTDDVQKLVLSGLRRLSHAAFLFVRLGDAPASRRWLSWIGRQVTPASRPGTEAERATQIALSPSGLAALGAPAGTLAALPQEAKEGMAARARTLGDTDASAPSRWSLGAPGQRIDALLLLYGAGETARDALVAEHRQRLDECGATPVAIELTPALTRREPFGFADGLSQPFMMGRPDRPAPGQDTVPTGEILLGYPNAYGRLPASPRLGDHDIGRNGTYLVFRKLEQDVAGFWRHFDEQAGRLDGQPGLPSGDRAALRDWLAARAMGRWRSGASTVLSPGRDDPAQAAPEHVNDFGYLDSDRWGERCPIGSHVRRANPRDARGGSAAESRTVVERHRILRRGRAYGAPLSPAEALALPEGDRGERGLYFIGLQANIARGFEFIQQTWLSNRGFHGLFDEVDPIAGGVDGGAFTIPARPVRLRLRGVPRFVTTRGGGYFFLPSIAALHLLAGD